jgi:hypothetical protein
MKTMKRLTSKPQSISPRKIYSVNHRFTRMNTDTPKSYHHEEHEGHEDKSNLGCKLQSIGL